MSLKDKYPNQSYVGVPILISGSNVRHVFAVIADHGITPTKVEFQKVWPWRVEVWGTIYVPTNLEVIQNKGNWTGSWEHIKFLTDDNDLISLATKMCAIVTNGKNSFITSNMNNERPSFSHCE